MQFYDIALKDDTTSQQSLTFKKYKLAYLKNLGLYNE